MHTSELTSPKVSISLRFSMQKKDFSLFSEWINFRHLFAPANCLTNYRFSGRLFKFLIVCKKRCNLDGEIDLLIGSDNYWRFLTGEVKRCVIGKV